MAYERHVFLNFALSRSKSRAPREFPPPLHGARELFELLRPYYERLETVVYPDVDVDLEGDQLAASRANSSAIRIRHMRLQETAWFDYVCLLVEHIDDAATAFPVVNRVNFTGRELEGEAEERGAATCHVVIRLPKSEEYDDGKYRAVIEVVQGVSRRHIDNLINRLLRRFTEDWTFVAQVTGKNGKIIERTYKYWPKLDFNADLGRALGAGPQGSILSHMLFTKRRERLNAGQETDVEYADLLGDVEIRVSAKQAPEDAEAGARWLQGIKEHFRDRGYESKLFFRHAGGSLLSSKVRHDEAAAADIMLCPKEIITCDGNANSWVPELSGHVISKLQEILDRDGLW